MRFFDRFRKPAAKPALPDGVVAQTKDGFIQKLTPEREEEMRQSIIRGRESLERQKAQMAGLPFETQITMLQVMGMSVCSQAQYESVCALRWGVTVPQEGGK